MNIKQKIKESIIVVLFRTILQQLIEALSIYKYVTDGNKNDIPIKLQTEIAIAIHALEKGMSIGNGRIGFGKEKALCIINSLQRLWDIGGDKVFVIQSVGTLKDYINYNVTWGADMTNVTEKLQSFCLQNNLENIPNRAGLMFLEKQCVLNSIHQDFSQFSLSRHSVRDFSDEPLDMEKIREALMLCERTPSACNRQSWRIHVYSDLEKRNRMFELQYGARGFYDKMQCAILICANLNYYNISELNLAYVDGGLYAMNLLYALHYQGLAAIPLTMGIKQGVLKKIKTSMDIPKNETPVLLIGVGTYNDKFKVAYSHRLSYKNYTTFY